MHVGSSEIYLDIAKVERSTIFDIIWSLWAIDKCY